MTHEPECLNPKFQFADMHGATACQCPAIRAAMQRILEQAADPGEIKVERALAIEPGKTYVIEVEPDVSWEQVEQMRTGLRQTFPESEFVVLCGAHIAVDRGGEQG